MAEFFFQTISSIKQVQYICLILSLVRNYIWVVEKDLLPTDNIENNLPSPTLSLLFAI